MAPKRSPTSAVASAKASFFHDASRDRRRRYRSSSSRREEHHPPAGTCMYMIRCT